MGIGVGTEIEDKLRLLRPLGQGSAGEVWLARHLRLGSDVAVKFLNREVSASDTARERFVREARTIAKIRSPHVVQVYDFGFHDGHGYIVMEHLVGETLEARIERLGALPVDQVARICTQIAKALQKAHDAGIIHRDIKPANVFLVDYGDEEIAKVVDFGIVKSVGGNLSASTVETLTQAGSVLGTPYYMSPEQIQDSGNVGPQADLWALGVIAYECTVGKLPFTAPNFPTLVMAICRDAVPVPSSVAPVPPGFDAWVARALHRSPAARFASAKDLARELCQALLFGDGSDCLSMPDAVMPPDLLWSGAYPSALGSSKQGAGLESGAGRVSITGSDRPSAPTPADNGDSERPKAGIPNAVVRGAMLPQLSPRINPSASQDGSLDSQIAPNLSAPISPRAGAATRAMLYAGGAVVLLALGWFANRTFYAPPSVFPDATAVAVSSTPASPPSASVASPRSSPAASSASAPTDASTAPSAPRAAMPAAPRTAGKIPSASPNGPAPIDAPAPTPQKLVDPLEERQ